MGGANQKQDGEYSHNLAKELRLNIGHSKAGSTVLSGSKREDACRDAESTLVLNDC